MSWSPSFIGIGAEKSATTWAWTILNEHPSVRMSQPKELNFFNLDENFGRGESWYRQHFATDANCSGEISPLYMDDPRVAERIRSVYPDSKILVMLRHPFDRAMSHLFHDASVHYGKVATVVPEQLQALVDKDDKYIRRSRYHAALAPFFDVFPANQIGVFYFDEVKSDGLNLSRRLYEFAGVDSNFVPEQFNKKVNESQDLRPAAKLVMGVSRAIRAFPPTHAGMQWIYRHTQLREKVIRLLMVDRGRAEIRFDEVFSSDAAAELVNDLNQLSELLPSDLPADWAHSCSHEFSAAAKSGGLIAA